MGLSGETILFTIELSSSSVGGHFLFGDDDDDDDDNANTEGRDIYEPQRKWLCNVVWGNIWAQANHTFGDINFSMLSSYYIDNLIFLCFLVSFVSC